MLKITFYYFSLNKKCENQKTRKTRKSRKSLNPKNPPGVFRVYPRDGIIPGPTLRSRLVGGIVQFFESFIIMIN